MLLDFNIRQSQSLSHLAYKNRQWRSTTPSSQMFFLHQIYCNISCIKYQISGSTLKYSLVSWPKELFTEIRRYSAAHYNKSGKITSLVKMIRLIHYIYTVKYGKQNYACTSEKDFIIYFQSDFMTIYIIILSHQQWQLHGRRPVHFSEIQGSAFRWLGWHTSTESWSTAGAGTSRAHHSWGGNLAPAQASYRRPRAGSQWPDEGLGEERS